MFYTHLGPDRRRCHDLNEVAVAVGQPRQRNTDLPSPPYYPELVLTRHVPSGGGDRAPDSRSMIRMPFCDKDSSSHVVN